MPTQPRKITGETRQAVRDRLIDLLLALQEVLDSIAPDARDMIEQIEQIEHNVDAQTQDDSASRVLAPIIPFANVAQRT